MASKGIGVPFVADVKDFLKGTGQVEDALDDVIDALDDVARDGKDVGRVIERSMQDVERATDDTADNLQDEFRDAFDKVERDARRSGRDIGDKLDDGLRGSGAKGKAGEFASEIGQEFTQNIGETIGSAGGKVSVANGVDALLGTAGGILPLLGPLGAGLGVGALLVKSIIDGVNANAQALADRMKELTDNAFQTVSQGYRELADEQQAAMSITGKDNVADAWQEIARRAKAAGVSTKSYWDIVSSGRSTDIDYINEQIDAHTTYGTIASKSGAIVVPIVDAEGKAWQQLRDDTLAQKDAVDRAVAATQAQASATGQLTDAQKATRDEGQRFLDQRKDMELKQDEVNDKVSTELTRRKKVTAELDKQLGREARKEAILRRQLAVLRQQNDAKRSDPRYVM